MQTAWCDLRECHLDPGLKAEDYAVQRALDHFDRLSCLGGVLVVEGRVEAFSLGEPLRPEMAVIHIEKGNPQIKGIYAAMNQMFLEQTFSGVELVNREQDLGEPGLREAKQSYRPVAMVDKFAAVLKA